MDDLFPASHPQLGSAVASYDRCRLVAVEAPIAVTLLHDGGGGFLAVAGLEVRSFLIARGGQGNAPLDVSEALLALPCRREILHVIAADDAGLRVGWLVVGRGATPTDAGADAGCALRGISTLIADDRLDVVAIDDATRLLALLDPVLRGGVALRRVPLRARARLDDPPTASSTVLPWTGAGARWAMMLDALSRTSSSLVVRLVTGVPLEENERSAIETAAREATALVAAAESASLRRGPTVDEAQMFAAVAHARLRRLSRFDPVRADIIVVCGDAHATPEVCALASAVFAPRAVELPPPRIALVPLSGCAALAAPASLGLEHVVVEAGELAALARTAEPPQDESSPLPTTRARVLPLVATATAGTPIGSARVRGKPTRVCLDDDARSRHVYVVGQTGTGKSTLLLSMILDDIARGLGVTVVDPHGTLIDDVLARLPRDRAEDVVLLDPEDPERAVPLNPLKIDEQDPQLYVRRRDRVIDELLDTCRAVFGEASFCGPIFEQAFRTVLTLLLGGRPPHDYVPILPMFDVVLNDRELRAALARRLGRDDPVTAETLRTLEAAKGESSLECAGPYVTSKLNRFFAHAAARRILCQPDCLDVAAVIRERRILLVPLVRTRVGTEGSAVLARQIVTRLVTAAVTSAQVVPHAVYVDEFHTFATEQFSALLAEARKFGLRLVLAHQYTAQLRGHGGVLAAILGNVGTMLAFRVGTTDAQLLAPQLGPPAVDDDLVTLPSFRALARSTGALGGTPFSLRTAPAPARTLEAAAVDAVRRLARLKHGRDGACVDADIFAEIARLRRVGHPKRP